MNKYIFFGGKGGVGKTTSSSAFAWSCAESGEKVLLVSTDPAHSLSDIFETKIGGDIQELAPNLFALEIDPESESRDYIRRIKKDMSQAVSPVVVNEIQKQLDAASVSPGSEESAIFDKLIEIINDFGPVYDRIVFDTAPTGHTLRLLSLPELLGGWLDRLVEKRIHAVKLMKIAEKKGKTIKQTLLDDPVIRILKNRKEKLERARDILIDRGMMSFVFVLNPERLPIEETKKAVRVLEKYHIHVNALIVNRILPDFVEGEFWDKRKALEAKYMNIIEEEFPGKKIIKIPLMQSEVSKGDLAEMAKLFSPGFTK